MTRHIPCNGCYFASYDLNQQEAQLFVAFMRIRMQQPGVEHGGTTYLYEQRSAAHPENTLIAVHDYADTPYLIRELFQLGLVPTMTLCEKIK